jgi:putative DNA primase/helicase
VVAKRSAHPSTIPHLFAYLREARKRNICLIRDAPANLQRQPTLRQVAGIGDRGDHGFIDEPNRLFPLDFDDVKTDWHTDDPARAIRTLVALLGEPWTSTSFVWFFSATHGLELDAQKRWTGNIDYSRMRVRIIFIAERALGADEAKALTTIAKAIVPEIDRSIVDRVHVNYIQRPHWVGHPGRDVLGNIQTIGWIKGADDTLAVPDDLTYRARWAKAQGHSSTVADHPDAESAVRAIGSDGEVRSHQKAAVWHLLLANPMPETVSVRDHAIGITDKLRTMLAQHRDEITANCVRCGRSKHTVDGLLQHMNADWALWCLNNLSILRGKTIKLAKEERAEKIAIPRWKISGRVVWSVEDAYCEALEATIAVDSRRAQRAGAIQAFEIIAAMVRTGNDGDDPTWRAQLDKKIAAMPRRINSIIYGERGEPAPPVRLLAAPTGTGKSTQIRAFVVQYVTERPEKTAAILVPRHQLGDEHVELLQWEHPDADYRAAIWRGRHAWNPHVGNGREQKMCRRWEEAAAVEKALCDVEHSLCKQRRGKEILKCRFYDDCAFQQQKQIKANIWFAAHEMVVHEMPKVFGDVGWVIFDESPLDAFIFGVDINDQVKHELDILGTPLPIDQAKFGSYFFKKLTRARQQLYSALAELHLPTDSHQGAAVPRGSLDPFTKTDGGTTLAGEAYSLTWRGKAKLGIRPDMSWKQIQIELQKAAVNDTVKNEVTLWTLVQQAASVETMIEEAIDQEVTPQELLQMLRSPELSCYGRIQVHCGAKGRVIRMVGLNERTEGWNVPTLICDATGDAELLREVWPQLKESKPCGLEGWGQPPRPANVRIFQCVDRAISRWAVAVEGKTELERITEDGRGDLERRIEGARRLYAAVLTKALGYGGAEVGIILYKATRDWIERNYPVPDWLKLMHWGDLTGTNTLQHVRALFVIGRPLPAAEDVTRQAEALSGDYIPQREYVEWKKGGRIPIIPDAGGNNVVLVDVWEHPHPLAEQLRRQVTEVGLIQAVGRARAGLRTAGEPLDIHLWTDVPVPELGPVEPVQWRELEAGLDGLMLAAGCWLKNIADAARAFDGIFSADGLKKARRRIEIGRRGGGVGTLHIGESICKVPQPPLVRVFYQRKIAGCKPTEAIFLRGAADPRAWLEERLGPLAYFEVVGEGDVATNKLSGQ